MSQTILKTIEYLNYVAGTDFTPDYQPTIELLNALINNGYGLHDFKTVIDKKWSHWKGTKYQQFMRPSTLFGKNFENYLHEQRNQQDRIGKHLNAASKAKQYFRGMD